MRLRCMGRLSDYINSNTGGGSSDFVQVTGIIENIEMFEHLLTTEPGFDKEYRKVVRKVLKEARRNLSKDAASYIQNDPRKAARAVKHTVYKQVFGGNLSILQKRKAGAKYELRRQRKLDQNPHQRGGNRRPRSQRTIQLDTYFGADRGFVLRFLQSGTAARRTRFGNRGSIRPSGWFGHTAPWQMEAAAENVAAAVNDYIKTISNG